MVQGFDRLGQRLKLGMRITYGRAHAGVSGEAGDEESVDSAGDFSPKTMLAMAVATSIDALAVGVTFAFLDVNIVPAVSFIGVVTFLCAGAGVKIGQVFGLRFKAGAERFGGLVLIAIGLKILIEHLFFGG